MNIVKPADNPSAPRRVTCDVTGIVQGVGFRPTVCRLARAAGLGGSVQNRSGCVRLVLEGEPQRIRAFLADLPGSIPPHARLDAIMPVGNCLLESAPQHPFQILASSSDEGAQVLIPADLAICPDCRREILNPSDRRYGYAFTTCTRCGPRYTVIHGLPYDRVRTTMSVFPLCTACRREYDNPADRRFHAESMACPVCGPRLRFEDAQGRSVAGDPLRQARAALAAGAVVAVRGLGGFLLAADAANRRTLEELRRRKHRPDKPFAVMARELALVAQACECDPGIARLLDSATAPIVIMEPRAAAALPLDLLSPDTQTLGVMLPTTPLHLLLATPLAGDPTLAFDWLVMTSGNRGGEPICITNDEARERLRGIADYFLLHDREINLRCDDSICVPSPVLEYGGSRGRSPSLLETTTRAAAEETAQVWRRARGLAPDPILLRHRLRRTVLAMGAELKNAIAMGYADRVIASPHIGDLEAPEAVDSLRQVADALPRFVNRVPECVAVDLHPDMHSTRIGREIARCLGVPVREVQHHHAHAAACLGEHGLQQGLALVFDGTGLGTDGHIWGAELLEVRDDTCHRLASFAGVPLPGGDAAVQRPARQLAGRCVAAGIELPVAWRAELGITDEEWQVWRQQCVAGVQAPITHAAGRLFDAFAAALGLASRNTTYEGQSAIRLEAAARRFIIGTPLPTIPYRATREGDMLWIDWSDAFRLLLVEASSLPGRDGFTPSIGRPKAVPTGSGSAATSWAYAAHVAIAAAGAEMVRDGIEATTHRVVALSGGVFMNRILTALLVPQLEALGLTVLQHRHTPPNDGCIAIGQALVAGVYQAITRQGSAVLAK
ncbi:MAG: carbamoyltransferase HypF [Kiritimatiellia bacterium]